MTFPWIDIPERMQSNVKNSLLCQLSIGCVTENAGHTRASEPFGYDSLIDWLFPTGLLSAFDFVSAHIKKSSFLLTGRWRQAGNEGLGKDSLGSPTPN